MEKILKNFLLKTRELPTCAIIVAGLFFLLLGYFVGNDVERIEHHFKHENYRTDDYNHSVDSFNEKGPVSVYTNPLLQGDGIDSFSNKFVYEVKDGVNDYIYQKKVENPSVKYVSVYFRDLNAGPIFGINDQDKFIPGSLLKLPLMMGVLKKSESDPKFLTKEVIYNTRDDDYKPYYKPRNPIKFGNKYTVSELLNSMIVYSDNDATSLLSSLLSDQEFNSTYSELGIDAPKDATFSLTVQTYASFFRILYNASYINPILSGKALRLLANTDFDDGLVAGVPEDVTVAHKFGERSGFGLNQLHDCGIIYYPEHPYVLCVMTRGDNFPDLAETIKGISSLVYNKINSAYNK